MSANSITRVILSNIRKFWLLVFFLLFASSPFIFLLIFKPSIADLIVTNMNEHQWILRIARWGIIAIIILSWPYWVNWLGQKTNIHKEDIAYWQAEKFRIAIWLILFDLLVCENIIFKLIHIA